MAPRCCPASFNDTDGSVVVAAHDAAPPARLVARLAPQFSALIGKQKETPRDTLNPLIQEMFAPANMR